MKKQKNYYEKAICLLSSLHKERPSCPLAVHIATAFSAYKDIYSLQDKQFYEILLEYKNLIEMDVDEAFDLNKALKEGLNLHTMFEEEDIE